MKGRELSKMIDHSTRINKDARGGICDKNKMKISTLGLNLLFSIKFAVVALQGQRCDGWPAAPQSRPGRANDKASSRRAAAGRAELLAKRGSTLTGSKIRRNCGGSG